MPLETDHTSAVVVGFWNPAIITPTWVLENEIVTKPQAEKIQLQFNTSTKGLRFDLDGKTWTIDGNRLVIKSELMADCGVVAAKLLDLLPHTPIQAVGANFVFKCSTNDWPADRLPKLGGDKTEWEQADWVGMQTESDTQMQIAVKLREDFVVVAVNLHRNVPTTNKAKDRLLNWEHDRKRAIDLIKSTCNLADIKE